MTVSEIRGRYFQFFIQKGHIQIPSASLVPKNDPTTLFISSGMQPLLLYFAGQPHPKGKRIVNAQKCFRSQDIEEVGNTRHTTFFEMLGNWSFGDYFKKEQLFWFFEFLTAELGLDPKRLLVTVFAGDKYVPRDTESVEIWKEVFSLAGIEAGEERIFYYGAEKNWWSRQGAPEQMSTGEPGGPDSEVFYDFGEDLRIHENSGFKSQLCHPNCDCGRFLEIGNSVFMMYKKLEGGAFEELPNKNIDFGGGLERLATATQNQPDIYRTGDFFPMIQKIERLSRQSYEGDNMRLMRIMVDHLRAALFIMVEGVEPSNKERGYVLRRLIRRLVRLSKILGLEKEKNWVTDLIELVVARYKDIYLEVEQEKQRVIEGFLEEKSRFEKALDRGLQRFEREAERSSGGEISDKTAFDLYQNFGFPIEMTEEMARERGLMVDRKGFEKEKEKHQKVSKKGAKNRFLDKREGW